MNVLGIGAPFGHDPAAALVMDGEVVAAAEEERFTRVKHACHALPVNAVRFCLERAGIAPADVDIAAFAWSPESHRRHRWRAARRKFRDSPLHALAWLVSRERILRRRIEATLRGAGISPESTELALVDHHLAHASSTYHLSGFDSAAIMTIDGEGEFTTTLLAEADGLTIRPVHEVLKPDSLGTFYAAVTEYLGFERNDGEFKVMGMSCYGDASSVSVEDIVHLTDSDRSFRLDGDWVLSPGRRLPRVVERFLPRWLADDRRRHAGGKLYTHRFVERWGPPRVGDDLSEPHTHVAAATQAALEDITTRLMERHLGPALRRHGRLCLAGGCALNVRLNRKLLAHPLVDQIYVQPAANDSGSALGAATSVVAGRGTHLEPMRHAYHGPSFSAEEIRAALEDDGLPFRELPDESSLLAAACDLLIRGEIVGWFQGAMEFGPRALGHRSILGHPGIAGLADDINRRVKFREPWRPFCPSVLAEDASGILGSDHPSPFMNLSFVVEDEFREPLREVVHVDGSARPQTVTEEISPRFYRLLKEFKRRTGIGVLINTSLNRRGEPMVCSPADALAMLRGSGLEHVFLDRFQVGSAVSP